jgi:response regulator RpfG family c-di-GMP phosphodiesterase
MKTTIKILILDDQLESAQSLQGILRREYEVIIFVDPYEALNYLKLEKVSLIISDQKMPKMSGVDFLAEVRSIQPSSIRFLVSGHLRSQPFKEAIDNDDITHYFEKTNFNHQPEISRIIDSLFSKKL